MNYLKAKLDSKLGSKVIWQNLRDAVSSNNVKPTLTADKYNKYLASRASTTAQRPVPRTSNSNERAFAFKNVTYSDVGRVIQSIKSKAIALDNIPIVFVKSTLAFTLPVLTHIINLTSSNIPQCWKVAKVIPNHKKTRSRGLDDFRPLSILPCLSKVLEILAKEQLVEYLQNSAPLDSFQTGFRPKHLNTETALLYITDHIRRSFERKQLTILLLQDFSKVFDTIQHDKLLQRQTVTVCQINGSQF